MSDGTLLFQGVDLPLFYQVTTSQRRESDFNCDYNSNKTEDLEQTEPVVRAERHWIPPCTTVDLHEFLDIAPKVRSILNKLTPEKFQKLTDDLLNLELSSKVILKGVVIFIFNKALVEHIYSPVYARLCRRLDDEAPNLQPPGSPSTFRILLLDKCQSEFSNGPELDEAFQSPNGTITSEEEEWRYMAKHRTLGNIKFIGELVKVDVISEGVAHHCIQKMLPRQHHDGRKLECLVQLIKTCGKKLDSARGRIRMDQYFSHIETLSECLQLMPRFRFMLLNLIDLRKNEWKPRKIVSCEGPVPIAALQIHDEKDQGLKLLLHQNSIGNVQRNNYSQRGTSYTSHRRQRRRRKLRDNQNMNINTGGQKSDSEEALGNLHIAFASQTICEDNDQASDSHGYMQNRKS